MQHGLGELFNLRLESEGLAHLWVAAPDFRWAWQREPKFFIKGEISVLKISGNALKGSKTEKWLDWSNHF